MKTYIKPPFLTTSFAGNVKTTEKRFGNILDGGMKKTGAVLVAIGLMIVLSVGCSFALHSNASETEKVLRYTNDQLGNADTERPGYSVVINSGMGFDVMLDKTDGVDEKYWGKPGYYLLEDLYNPKTEKSLWRALLSCDGQPVKTDYFETHEAQTALKENLIMRGSVYYPKIYAYVNQKYQEMYAWAYADYQVQFLNYREDEKNGEATFIVHLTWHNKGEPEDDEYAKKLKANNSPYYEQYCREYKMQQEGYNEHKAVVKGDAVILYTNVSPKGVQWEREEWL